MTTLELPASRPPRIVDAILEAVRPPARRRTLVLAIAAALLAHLLPLAALLRSRPSLEPWAASLAARVHLELVKETLVEATPPPPTPPPRRPATPPPPAARPSEPHDARPPPPAQAGQVIAQLPDPSGPLDLTGETFVSGTSASYVGGVTSSSGTGKHAVESLVVDPAGSSVDRSRPVGLLHDDWHCPWPVAAESAEVDQTVAIVRVEVLADGSPGSVSVVRDPGMGFGEAAVGCALRERFEPARDRSGAAVAALSPPIRVRFTR